MQQEKLLQKITQTIVESDEESLVEYINMGLEDEIDPVLMIQAGLKKGMDEIGERFGRHEMFIPEMISGAETFKYGVNILNPKIEALGKTAKKDGLIMLGTVKGDIHDLGKNIIGLMYSVNGFEVIDLGVDLPDEFIIAKVKELRPDILGLSSMLTNTREKQKDIIKLMDQEGLRKRTKVIIGGAVVNEEWMKSIGADGMGVDATDAVNTARTLLGL